MAEEIAPTPKVSLMSAAAPSAVCGAAALISPKTTWDSGAYEGTLREHPLDIPVVVEATVELST